MSLLHLVQAVVAMNWHMQPRLWLVTCGAQAIHAQDQVVSLAQSSLWGLGRVIVYEHPDLRCTLVDIDPACLPDSVAALFREVWFDDSEDEIVLRDNRRFAARLVRYKLPGCFEHDMPETVFSGETLEVHQGTSSNRASLFRTDGTYLITGGLGGIGLKVAQWMVEQGAKHLVLIGRSGASTSAEITLSALREAGAQIKIIKADIALKQQVANALEEIYLCMPPLRGILHSAVVLDDGTLLQLNQDRFLSVMQPKIDGAWNLHELTLHQPLDFFVMFSSAASLIGSPGQGNYAAANAFMDALAHYRRSRGYPALSINWGRWSEVGQATLRDRSERLASRGFASIKPQYGLTMLGRLLQQSLPQVGVMSFNMRKWSQFYPRLRESSLFSYLIQEEACERGEENGSSRLTRDGLLSMGIEQRRQAAEKYLSEQIARVLSLSTARLDEYQQLSRLGIDSLMSVELKNRIESDLKVVVPVATFLQGITLNQLTTQVLQHIH